MSNMEKEQAAQEVRILAERMAMLYSHFVQVLCKKYGEPATEEIVKEVIMAYGKECGEMAKEAVLRQGLENTLSNHGCSHELPSVGWTVETLSCSDKEKVVQTDYCPFAATWKARGEEKWGRMYCFVDQAKFSTYCDGLETVHEKNVLDGADCCLMRVTKKE